MADPAFSKDDLPVPSPVEQAHRSDVLRSCGVYDSAPPPDFDRLAAWLAEVCETPIAVVCLADEHAPTLASSIGLDAATAELALALCAGAIEQASSVLIDDGHAAPQSEQHAGRVLSEGLRLCAVVPVLDGHGAALGAVAVMDRRARGLDAAQTRGLHTIAEQVGALLNALRRQRRLEDALVQRSRGAAALVDSLPRWQLMYERNPRPMWIYDVETLRFLTVNDAAVAHYGWSVDEFLSMTIKDIRPTADVPDLLRDLAQHHVGLDRATLWRHRTKDGRLIHVDITAHSMPFMGREGRLVLAEDVTERLRGEQALRQSEARWQRLFDASATGIASADAEGRFLRANPAFCALLGRDERELVGSPVLGFTHPDDLAGCEAALRRLGAGEIDSFNVDKRYVRPDGRAVWARASVALAQGRDDQSAPEFVAVVQDIDAQQAALEHLRRTHALIGLAGRMARFGGWALTLPDRELRWSDELLTILDCPPGQVPTLEEALSWYPEASLQRAVPAIDACLEHGTPFDIDVDIHTARGRLLSVRVIGQAMRDAAGRIVGAQGALHDHTERQRAAKVLRESEERFRNVARATADAVWDWDLSDDSLWWNDGIQTLFGHDRATLEPGVGAWTDRIHPGDRERVTSSLHAVIDGGADRWSSEYRFLRADETYAVVLDRGFVIRDADGHALRMVGSKTDLTAQRDAESRLQQQAALLEAARDAITVTDLTQRITYWSRGAERVFGWTTEEAMGRSMPALLRQDALVTATAHAEVLERGAWTATLTQINRDGVPVVTDARWTLLRDAAGEPSAVLAIKTDVTQRLALEAQLQQSQRLEAVGQLTGGVAHDFNNLLTVILGNAELLAERLVDQPALLPLAQMTRTAAERGAELTQRLLAFARKQALQPQAVDAHQLLVAMDALLRRTLPANIELQLVRAAGLWPALADAAQLESAVLNLVLNARDAMPSGGKITLETANAWIDQDYAERHADVLPGQYVLLSVSDTGSGMTGAQLARVFEPFYTTKGVGKGSGLGLSMVYGFARQSRGHVKLYSEPGHGTTARLYLPRADQPARAAEPASARPGGVDLRGSVTVLVVEDDDLVRRHATELLSGLGYRVLTAEHGAAGLELIRLREDIELLFTDVVMPGELNGRQLAEAALALRPHLKVLYTSGYTENAIVHHGRLDRGVHLLPKPYRSIDLARKVHAVLTGGKP